MSSHFLITASVLVSFVFASAGVITPANAQFAPTPDSVSWSGNIEANLPPPIAMNVPPGYRVVMCTNNDELVMRPCLVRNDAPPPLGDPRPVTWVCTNGGVVSASSLEEARRICTPTINRNQSGVLF